MSSSAAVVVVVPVLAFEVGWPRCQEDLPNVLREILAAAAFWTAPASLSLTMFLVAVALTVAVLALRLGGRCHVDLPNVLGEMPSAAPRPWFEPALSPLSSVPLVVAATVVVLEFCFSGRCQVDLPKVLPLAAALPALPGEAEAAGFESDGGCETLPRRWSAGASLPPVLGDANAAAALAASSWRWADCHTGFRDGMVVELSRTVPLLPCCCWSCWCCRRGMKELGEDTNALETMTIAPGDKKAHCAVAARLHIR